MISQKLFKEFKTCFSNHDGTLVFEEQNQSTVCARIASHQNVLEKLFAFKLIHYCQITNMYLNKRQLHRVACKISVLILSLFDSFSISCLFQICLFAKMLSRIGRKACYLCFIWAIFDLYNET